MSIEADLRALYEDRSAVIALDTELARFFAKVDVADCWLWTGSCNPRYGYAQFSVKGKTQGAHRWLYQRLVRKLRRTEQLDHLCRVRRCVNPDHLEVVTQQENIARGRVGDNNRLRTRCPAGHLYDYTYPNGRRGCRTCKRDWARAHAA